jgi:hypothetical protein
MINVKQDLKDRQAKSATTAEQLTNLKKKLIALDDETISLETKAKMLQEMLDKEKQKDLELTKLIKATREARKLSPG